MKFKGREEVRKLTGGLRLLEEISNHMALYEYMVDIRPEESSITVYFVGLDPEYTPTEPARMLRELGWSRSDEKKCWFLRKRS